jgi:hypothetical protein
LPIAVVGVAADTGRDDLINGVQANLGIRASLAAIAARLTAVIAPDG